MRWGRERRCARRRPEWRCGVQRRRGRRVGGRLQFRRRASAGSVQPQPPPCETASSTPTRPPASRTIPGQSVGPALSDAFPRGTQATTIAVDATMRMAPRTNIQRQDGASTTIPPTTKARPAPSPIIPGIQPKAAASRGPLSRLRAKCKREREGRGADALDPTRHQKHAEVGRRCRHEGSDSEDRHHQEQDPAVAEAVT